MARERVGDGLERVGDFVRLLGWRVDLEDLHGDELFAHAVLGAIDRTEDTNPNLMENAEGAEGNRRRGGIGEVVNQLRRRPSAYDTRLAGVTSVRLNCWVPTGA